MKKVKLFIFVLFFLVVIPLTFNIQQVFANELDECILQHGGTMSKECCGTTNAAGTDLTKNIEMCKNTINILQPTGAISNISNVISGAVKLIIVVAGLIAFVYLLLGGIKWITSGGDSTAVETARNQIIQALIGIIVVLAAWALIVLVENATGACFGFSCPFKLDGIFLPQ